MANTKQAVKKGSQKIMSDPEAIRIVPLYHPKPDIKLEGLSKEKEDIALFGDATGKPAAIAKLVYNGGPLLTYVKVFTIFWGKNWKANPAFSSLKDKINKFFTDILVSPLIDQLKEYSRPGSTIGHGSHIGSIIITKGAPSKSITDSKIQTTISSWITAGTVPAWDANTLYFIYMDKGVKVIMGGGASCTSFCGYHNDIKGKKYYAVMPFPICAGCLANLSAFDALTGTSSHELCEAITDPAPPTGWYDNANGEIGDICAWKFKSVAGYNVQLEWSNNAKACV